MKKALAILYCKEKALEGYMTHLMILDIYDDDDDIPQDVIDMICYKPEPPRKISLIMSHDLYRAFMDAMEGYYYSQTTHQEIADEIKKKETLLKQ